MTTMDAHGDYGVLCDGCRRRRSTAQPTEDAGRRAAIAAGWWFGQIGGKQADLCPWCKERGIESHAITGGS